jgi:gliding motility-associated lipoprotein GldK
MFMDEDEVFNDVRTWDVKQFKFKYKNSRVAEYLEVKEDLINQLANDNPPILNPTDEELELLFDGFKRSNFITDEVIEVYPDTTVWITDFKYSYNEPMHNDYFWHDAYNDYPVVGITWKQANAFCEWRTMHKNAFQKTKNKDLVPEFRLPTEAEWEYAARGGLQGASYPWGGPYTKNDRGCFMANFKPMRGDYAVDQALYTVEGDAYDANDYGLFNMSGNVAEWVDSSYESEAYDFSSTMNPNVNKRFNKKKITRGGSWKDVKYYLQVSTRDYEYEDIPRSFIGFRTVHDYLGTDLTANAQTNSSRIKR